MVFGPAQCTIVELCGPEKRAKEVRKSLGLIGIKAENPSQNGRFAWMWVEKELIERKDERLWHCCREKTVEKWGQKCSEKWWRSVALTVNVNSLRRQRTQIQVQILNQQGRNSDFWWFKMIIGENGEMKAAKTTMNEMIIRSGRLKK